MNDDHEGMFAVMASLLVIFTAMIEPVASASIAAAILAAAGIWKLTRAWSARRRN